MQVPCSACGATFEQPVDSEPALCSSCVALSASDLRTAAAPPGAGERIGGSLIGRTIASCEVIGRIGQGGMGTVYRARHLWLDKLVAIKVARARILGGDEGVARFLREARSAARIEHPNVVQVLDAGRDAGLHYIVMQLVEGEDLAMRLRREGRVAVTEALRIAEEVARALAAAHEVGIVHRDIKPSNVLLTRSGAVKVADFGLSRSFVAADGLTATGVVCGTPHYMSPEQCAGAVAGPASDLYALGVMLFAMLSGAPPFEAENALAVLEMHRSRDPGPISDRVAGIPPPVERLVARLLEKEPGKRPPTCGDLVVDLLALRRELGERSDVWSPPLPAPPRSGPGAAGEGRATLDRLLLEAIEVEASEVHIEPEATGFKVRFRVEGRLVAVCKLSAEAGSAAVAVCARYARPADSDPSAPRLGEIYVETARRRRPVHFRLASAVNGPRLIMRLLPVGGGLPSIDKVFLPQHVAAASGWLGDRGLVLVTGPDDSGKTTGLWTLIQGLDLTTRVVIAVGESAVYERDDVTWIEVADGASRAAALEAALLQLPEVLVIDELPDGQIGSAVARAALRGGPAESGTLCLANMHASSVSGALARLLEMGVEPALLAEVLKVVICQRLVRRACGECLEEYQPLPVALDRLGVPSERRKGPFRKGRGCERCAGRGWRGRTVIYELFEPTAGFWSDLHGTGPETAIRQVALAHGLYTMRACALERVLRDETAIVEALAVLPA